MRRKLDLPTLHPCHTKTAETPPPPHTHTHPPQQVREEVYHQQIALQHDIVSTLAAVDRAAHGAETGALPHADVRTALRTYWRVGAPGGKMEARFDALAQSLDAVAPPSDGPVPLASLFAEDREFNQGEFAEAVRDQALAERLEFFGEVEAALTAQAGVVVETPVTRAHAAAALAAVDGALTPAAAWDAANAAFAPGEVASPQAASWRGCARARGGACGRRPAAASRPAAPWPSRTARPAWA